MADKIFIGKVEEKKFDNGGSIIKLTIGDKDKQLLNKPGFTTIEVKKSTKGNWYAEISQREQAATNNYQSRQQNNFPTPESDGDDLPF
jgi:hypothetical protein